MAILGLMLAGALAGALVGALLLTGFAIVQQGTAASFGLTAFLGGGFGALIGAFMTPIVGLLVLPSVPLGRALLETALGTLLGGVVGFSVPPVGPILGGVAGFLLAAVRLHVVFRRRRREADSDLRRSVSG
jgi:glycerol uptake facilitator-like aquaporin